MRRVEKVIGEARSLRILRAARVQAPDLLPPTLLGDDAWVRDCDAAGRIVFDLSEKRLADGTKPRGPDGIIDRRRGYPLEVLDFDVLSPFIDAVQNAIQAVVATMDPTRVVFEVLEPAVLSAIYPAGAPAVLRPSQEAPGEGSSSQNPPSPPPSEVSSPQDSKPPATFDPGRARRTAIEDASVLAWETVLFEAVRRVHRDNDARRVFNRHADLSDFLVDGSGVKRSNKLKAEAARKKAARLHARRVADGLEQPKPTGTRKELLFKKRAERQIETPS